jgi:GNAT superfamily N-acetyltransferase
VSHNDIPVVRLLTSNDVSHAMQLSTLAGWNQTAQDWLLLLELASESCFCLEVDGLVVATATLLNYGSRLGWIGMVLTHPSYRHRGFARKLLTHALAHADACGIRTVKLDATDQGQRLYESLGFRVEQPVERWVCAGELGRETCAVSQSSSISQCFEFDAVAFGADRSRLLNKLADRGACFVEAGAYLLTRPGRLPSYVGPCVSMNQETARAFLQRALATAVVGPWVWDLLPRNRHAVSLAAELGFSPQRQLMRMVRGDALAGDDQRVYAIAGFEFG